MSRRAWTCALGVIWAAPAALAAQPHPGGRWLTLETAHFHVHVREEDRGLGRRAAAEAESVYVALAAQLPAPSAAIELVVADNVDFTNGAATVYPEPAALVYAAPPVGDIELGNYDRWLHVGLAHELAHVFDLDLARGWWRLGRRILGRMPALFPNLYAPDWLIEGIAVYYESRLTGRGRLHASYHGAVIAAQDHERGALPVDAAVGLGPRWPAGIRPYAFGSRFLEWLRGEWGDSVVPRLIQETARRPIPYLWLGGALKPTTGLSLSQAWARWQDSLGHAASSGPARGGGAVLVRGLRRAAQPRVSADGRELLFVRDDGKDATRLAVLERGTGLVRTLGRLNGEAGLAWGGGGDGGDVAVSQFDLADPYTARSDLWGMGADGSERRLTWGARLRDPDLAPDGVIVAARLSVGGTELVLRDRAGLHVIAPGRPGVEWAQPRFAPDGRVIAAVRAVGGRSDIVLLTRSGDLLREVTGDPAPDRTPTFSPDGAWLFWSSDRDGAAQIFATRVDAAERGHWRVTEEPYGAYGPAAASDSVFYLAYHSDGFALAAVALDTTRWVIASADGMQDGAAPSAPEAAPDSGRFVEHPYRPWPSLLPRYWMPIVQGGAGATWIGALTTGQDALQRHTYGATVSLGLGPASGTWTGSFGYAYSRLVPWLLDASYSRELLLVDTLPGAAPGCCRVEESAGLGLGWRHVRWRTQVASRLGAEYERSGGLRRAGAVASLFALHVTEPAFAVSLQDGWAVSATVRQRWRTDTALRYHEVVAAAAAYRVLPLGGFARPVIAARASVGLLGGSERVVDGVGGIPESGVELVPGLTVGGGRRAFPVRGYVGSAILGRGAAAGTVELRVPLALVGRGLGLLPLYLDRLSVAAFADGGAAWFPRGFTTRLPASSTIGSLGGEISADLGVMLETPLRLRVGAARPLTGRRSPTAYVAFGPSF